MDRKLVFVCSPYSGDVKENTWIAAEVCKAIHKKTTYLPVAPHLYFPQFLNDNVQSERKAGIEYGLELMDRCAAVIVVCKDGEMSAGMKKEVEYAEKHHKPMLMFDDYHVLLSFASGRSISLEYLIKQSIILNLKELEIKKQPCSQEKSEPEKHPCSRCPHNQQHLLVCPSLCEEPMNNDAKITIQLTSN